MDFLKDKRKKQQLICSYSVFVMNGMLALSIGSLLPFIRDERGLDYAFCGLIVSLHSVGNLISSFMAGMLPIAVGRKKSILMFNALFAFSYLLIDQNLCNNSSNFLGHSIESNVIRMATVAGARFVKLSFKQAFSIYKINIFIPRCYCFVIAFENHLSSFEVLFWICEIIRF